MLKNQILIRKARFHNNSASVALLSGKKKWMVLVTSLGDSLNFQNVLIVTGDVFRAQPLTVKKSAVKSLAVLEPL